MSPLLSLERSKILETVDSTSATTETGSQAGIAFAAVVLLPFFCPFDCSTTKDSLSDPSCNCPSQ
jgi:hypothetical protein